MDILPLFVLVNPAEAMYQCKIELVYTWLKKQHYKVLSLTPESFCPSVRQKEHHVVFNPSLSFQRWQFEKLWLNKWRKYEKKLTQDPTTLWVVMSFDVLPAVKIFSPLCWSLVIPVAFGSSWSQQHIMLSNITWCDSKSSKWNIFFPSASLRGSQWYQLYGLSVSLKQPREAV